MELFTQNATVQDLQIILKTQLAANNQKNVVFENTPSMAWITTQINNVPLRIIHHQQVSRFGFVGNLIKIEIDSNVRGYTEKDQETLEMVSSVLIESLGGLKISFGTDIEGFDGPGDENSVFLLKQLHLHGINDEEISVVLEKILNQQNNYVFKNK